MSNPPQKISLYNIADLKNTTDDALAPYLTTLPQPYRFTQDHSKTDVRLALASTAVIIAGVLFYADWKLGWEATKPYTAPACVAYFVLNGLFTYWIWGVERNTVFVGRREGGQKLLLKSTTKKHDPTYNLHVSYTAPSGQSWVDTTLSAPFTTWFNTHGFIDQKAFKSWLAQNVEVIGLADPTSKASGEKKYEGVVDEVIAESREARAITSSSAVTSASTTTGMETSSARTVKTSTPGSAKTSKTRKA